jgi:hypothetical protein
MKNAAPRPGHEAIKTNTAWTEVQAVIDSSSIPNAYAATAFFAVGTDAIVFKICEAIA